MLSLIIGGSGSGKSAYAEEYCRKLAGDGPICYLAAMQASEDAEMQEKIRKHKERRYGKGFFTIEQPVQIERALEKMSDKSRIALLECVSNLTANEMFFGGQCQTAETVAERILAGIGELEGELSHIVVVTNNLSEDGIVYEETTKNYLRAMGKINQALAETANVVTEVVAGIPLVLKRG